MTATTAPAWPLAHIPRAPDDVWNASYPDFVAMLNQTNVMPGAHTTVNLWATHSRMDQRSRVLDVACTTGFASRELARLTGCHGTGFDLSADAVALARYNHRVTAPDLHLDYVQADGNTFDHDQPFTHIAVGAALGFFPDPAAMAARLVALLADGGHILAAPLWCDHPLPDDVAALRRDVFGITSPMETSAQARALFRGLDVMFEQHRALIPETDAEIEHYCSCTVNRACSQSGITNQKVREAMRARLRQIKQATNRLREHQRYSVLVLRHDPANYPDRYVELF